MLYKVTVEPMPENTAGQRAGDQSGLWRIVVEHQGIRSVKPRNPTRQIMAENLSFEEAKERSSKISRDLNEQ